MIVDKLLIGLGLRTEPSVRKGELVVERLLAGAKAIGAAYASLRIAEKINAIAQETAVYGDRLSILSDRLQISTRSIEQLRYAVAAYGAEQTQADAALAAFTAKIGEASFGKAVEGFDWLGIRVRDASGALKSTDRLLAEVADRLASTTDHTLRLRYATDLFGGAGADMVRLLARGSGELARLRREAVAYGAVSGRDLIESSERYQLSALRLNTALRNLRGTIGTQLLPSMSAMRGQLADWLRQNRELLAQNIASVFAAMARATRRVALALTSLIEKFDSLKQWQQDLVVLAGAITAVGVALALPLGKYVALAAVLAGLADDAVAFWLGQPSLIGEVVDGLDTLIDRFNKWIRSLPGADAALSSIADHGTTLRETFSQVVGFLAQANEKFAITDSILSSLSNLAAALGDALKSLAGWLLQLLAAGATLGTGLLEDVQTWLASQSERLGLPGDAPAAPQLANAVQALAAPASHEAAAMLGDAHGRPVPAASSINVSHAPTTNATVHVHVASSNASPEAIADAVERKLNELNERQYAETLAEMLPKPAEVAP
jgi:hypothetical protein